MRRLGSCEFGHLTQLVETEGFPSMYGHVHERDAYFCALVPLHFDRWESEVAR